MNWRFKSASSLRGKILAPPALFGLITLSLVIWIFHGAMSRRLDEEQTGRAVVLIEAVQGAAEVLGESPELTRMVNFLAGDPDVKLLVLAAGEPLRVVTGSRNAWDGLPVDEIPEAGVAQELMEGVSGTSLSRYQLGVDLSGFKQKIFITPRGSRRPVEGFVLLHLDTARSRQAADGVERLMAGVTVITILALLAVTLGILRRFILSPIHTIVQVMNRRSGGDLTARAMELADDEIGRVATSLNNMLSALNAAQERIEKQSHELGLQKEDLILARDQALTSNAKYRDLFESTRDAIIILEPLSGRIMAGNPSAIRLFKINGEEHRLSGTLLDLSPAQQPDGSASAGRAHELIETTRTLGSQLVEWTFMQGDGEEFPADVLFTWVAHGEDTLVYVTIRDIADRKRAEEQIARMADYDSLTELPNRRVFVDALDHVIARARRSATQFAVLYFDLDHFKDVNDTLGHPVGDQLLKEVATRVRRCVRAGDTVARFGGDEFAVILTDINGPVPAADVSERIMGVLSEGGALQNESAVVTAADMILEAVAAPYLIHGNQIRSGATIGIAVYGSDAPDAEIVLSQADVALYRGKTAGRGTYRFFNDAMDAEVRARVSMTTELREALAEDQLFLMYQPQVDIDTGRIVGLEALVRWRHPKQGTLGPGKFIPLAERTGLILPLGSWVMHAVCRQIRQWLDAGIALPPTAINLSGVQFKDATQLEIEIAGSVAEYGLAASLLDLELTESVLMTASREHNDLLVRLRKAGHRIAIDDFGSGYSSLDYLRRYPADRIKIAQTFTSDIGRAPGSDAIVRAALGLARELGLEVVVEGVETAAQLELLKAWGCRTVQGYYFAKPVHVAEMTAMLRIGKIIPANIDLIETPALAVS